jgi:hypothetical protein
VSGSAPESKGASAFTPINAARAFVVFVVKRVDSSVRRYPQITQISQIRKTGKVDRLLLFPNL